jgi:hypothetical protein
VHGEAGEQARSGFFAGKLVVATVRESGRNATNAMQMQVTARPESSGGIQGINNQKVQNVQKVGVVSHTQRTADERRAV